MEEVLDLAYAVGSRLEADPPMRATSLASARPSFSLPSLRTDRNEEERNKTGGSFRALGPAAPHCIKKWHVRFCPFNLKNITHFAGWEKFL